MTFYLPIRELARVALPMRALRGRLLMLKAFFDDSGTHDGSEITALGGFVASVDLWAEFEAAWGAVVNDFPEIGPIDFHSADWELGAGEFFGIPKPIRDAISRRLARVIGRCELQPVWAAVINEEWHRLDAPDFKAAYPKPYDFCFRYCINQVSRWSAERAKSEPAALIFSEQNEYRGRMDAIFRAYKDAKPNTPLKTLTFASYRDYLPLQGVDMYAYEVNRYWRELGYPANGFPLQLRVQGETILFPNGEWGGCFGRLGLANALRRFREEGFMRDTSRGKFEKLD